MKHTINYTHSYDYRIVLSGGMRLYRPIVTVQVFHGKNPTRLVDALLDSGADNSVFDSEIAETIGLDITTGRKENILGIGTSIGYKHKVWLRFGPLKKAVECEVYFISGLNKAGRPNLIGRVGVFNHLQIGFDEAQRKIYMALNS